MIPIMKVTTKLITTRKWVSCLQLEFPVPVQIPQAKRFKIKWGNHEAVIKDIHRLSQKFYELHFEAPPVFPIFEAGMYESFPDSSLSKIVITYDGDIRHSCGEKFTSGSEVTFLLSL